VGNIDGQLEKVAGLTENIQNKKGKFDVLLCVGRFLPPSPEYLESF